jgi:hypothetical protein
MSNFFFLHYQTIPGPSSKPPMAFGLFFIFFNQPDHSLLIVEEISMISIPIEVLGNGDIGEVYPTKSRIFELVYSISKSHVGDEYSATKDNKSGSDEGTMVVAKKR